MPEITLRDQALSLPLGHPARVAYRDYVRAQHNAREEFNAGQHGHGHMISDNASRHLATVTEKVEAAIAAGENERPVRHLEVK